MKNENTLYHKRARDILGKPFTSIVSRYLGVSIAIGIVTGLVIGVFRWIIDHTLTLLTIIYPFMGKHPLVLIPYVLGTFIVAWLIGKIVKPYEEDVVRSGVTQLKAVLLGRHRIHWWPVLWRKFVASLLTICPGLFLGREGPSIQIGACIGACFNEKIFHLTDKDKYLLMECGVAAGLSAAFSAPLAGTMFLLEEMTHNFNSRIWIPALTSSIVSAFITFLFFGTKPCLYIPITTKLPVASYPWLIVAGVVIGFLAYCFQFAALNLTWWYSKITFIPKEFHSIIPLLLVIPVGLWNPYILGGSHNFIKYVTNMSLSTNWKVMVAILLVYFILRFGGTIIAYGATVPGGIFMPLFVLGTVVGALTGTILIHMGIIPASCYVNVIIISMAAYFGGAEGLPFTAILLVTEMVGSVEQILPMTLITLVAYYVNRLLGGRPSLYDAMLEEK